MTIEEKAEVFAEYLRQLGYKKINSGAWISKIEDTGTGCPKTTHECPFCGHQSEEETNYCPDCGARLKLVTR